MCSQTKCRTAKPRDTVKSFLTPCITKRCGQRLTGRSMELDPRHLRISTRTSCWCLTIATRMYQFCSTGVRCITPLLTFSPFPHIQVQSSGRRSHRRGGSYVCAFTGGVRFGSRGSGKETIRILRSLGSRYYFTKSLDKTRM